MSSPLLGDRNSTLTERERQILRLLIGDQFEYDAPLRPCEATDAELGVVLDKLAAP